MRCLVVKHSGLLNTFMTDGAINTLIFDKRVLFVNGIRSDIPSGGNTATETLLRYLTIRCTVEIFSMATDLESKTAFAIKSFPAGGLIFLNRYWRKRWLEFFSRLSPWLLISLLFKYLLFRPDVLIFNHHCTFPFAYFFLSKKILVWHDVPSAKISKSCNRQLFDKYLCINLERYFLNEATQSWVLSFTEQKLLRRFYAQKTYILPALDSSPNLLQKNVEPNSWLLVANWNRDENRNGATDFFLAYLLLVRSVSSDLRGRFTIAGSGASNFLESLLYFDCDINLLEIQAVNHFDSLSQFNQSALLAPINEGAGIKLKTLEAWSCNMPVIGTAQAFSGLPSGLWKLGGIKLESPYEMARYCLNWVNSQAIIESLLPVKAYAEYLKATMQNDVG
jgi:hypothetical protein